MKQKRIHIKPGSKGGLKIVDKKLNDDVGRSLRGKVVRCWDALDDRKVIEEAPVIFLGEDKDEQN